MNIPKDLHLILCLNFDENFLNIYLKSHNLIFEKKDYIYLFSKVFPTFYTDNLYKYNVEKLYKDFLYINLSIQQMELERKNQIFKVKILKQYLLSLEGHEYIKNNNILLNYETFIQFFKNFNKEQYVCNNNNIYNEKQLSKIGLTNKMLTFLRRIINSEPCNLNNNIYDIVIKKDRNVYDVYKYIILEEILKPEDIMFNLIYENDDLETFIKKFYMDEDFFITFILNYKCYNIINYISCNKDWIQQNKRLTEDFYKDLKSRLAKSALEDEIYNIRIEYFKNFYENGYFTNRQFIKLIFMSLNQEIIDYLISKINDKNYDLLCDRLYLYLYKDELDLSNIIKKLIPTIIKYESMNDGSYKSEIISGLLKSTKTLEKYILLEKLNI